MHIGKGCLENYYCGLCESKFDNLEILETHLHTCEVYECGSCMVRLRTIGKIKKHAVSEHEEDLKVLHLKTDRWDEKNVDVKAYLLSQL